MEDKKDNQQIVSTMPTESLIQDLRHIIEQARGQVAATANFTQTMMYWHIGERINREVLGNQRAEYGKQIVAQVATQLQDEYGRKGFETRNIRRMMQCNSTRQASRLLSTLQSCLHARFCSARFKSLWKLLKHDLRTLLRRTRNE